jgi:hypothetical protein
MTAISSILVEEQIMTRITTLTVDLPEDVIDQLEHRAVSDKEVQLVMIQAIRDWLRKELDESASQNQQPSRFAESAVPYIDQLIDENRSLFDRLANLP